MKHYFKSAERYYQSFSLLFRGRRKKIILSISYSTVFIQKSLSPRERTLIKYTLGARPGRLLNIIYTFNLYFMSIMRYFGKTTENFGIFTPKYFWKRTFLVESGQKTVDGHPHYKKLYGPFLWMGFNCLKATEPLWRDSLLFTTKFPRHPGTNLIDFGGMKGWTNLGAYQWFWTRDSWY